MKSAIIDVVALVIAAGGSASLHAQFGRPETFDPDARRNGWIFSLQEGQTQARKTNQPLMVVLRCNP